MPFGSRTAGIIWPSSSVFLPNIPAVAVTLGAVPTRVSTSRVKSSADAWIAAAQINDNRLKYLIFIIRSVYIEFIDKEPRRMANTIVPVWTKPESFDNSLDIAGFDRTADRGFSFNKFDC